MSATATLEPTQRKSIKRQHKRVVIIDPYATFTHNASAALERHGASVRISKENAKIWDIEREKPTHIILGPSPGDPYKVPIFGEVFSRFMDDTPILGISVGMLAIALHFGSELFPCERPGDSKEESATHNGWGRLFKGIPNPFSACVYRRLVILHGSSKPETFMVSARNQWGEEMVIEGIKFPHVVGLAFQPESHFTKCGEQIFANFLSL